MRYHQKYESKKTHTRVLEYAKKTLQINLNHQDLRNPLRNKSFAPSSILAAVFSGLLMGKRSARELEKHHADVVARVGYGRSLPRSTLGERLDEQRVLEHLQGLADNLFLVAKNLRLLKPATSSHKVVALLDGIDLGQVHAGGGRCDLCLERKVGEAVRLYHRIVVISVMSKYGPMPLFMRVCRPNEIALDPMKVSSDRFKSDCELSCAKEMLVDIAGRFGGKLPFDIMASDALMANAPFMELTEALGSKGIFIFKQENRKLYREAKADFLGHSLGLNINQENWGKDPAQKGRTFTAKWGQFCDINRKGENKSVRIFETTRTEKDGETTTGMAITSDDSSITPQLVEEVRYAKWASLENGVFNELTNIWGTLKHLFFHKKNALQSMLILQFLALIAYRFFCFGNLRRGGRCFNGTVRDFHHHMTITFFSCRRSNLIEALCNSP